MREPRTAAHVGRESLSRVRDTVDAVGGEIGELAADLLARHGYDPDGAPHANVLGHPLFELAVWLADGGPDVPDAALADICESGLWGYLAVRAEDDLLDEGVGDPAEVVILAGWCRSRHQSLLAAHVSTPPFWRRFDGLWRGYAEAMLLERSVTSPDADYGPDEFRAVLGRSQPLEIPGLAVLALQDRWDEAVTLATLVHHVAAATQLFDDFVDAPADLAAGNHTWMVRRLGGSGGATTLARRMVVDCDRVFGEASTELDAAVEAGRALGIPQIEPWAAARQAAMDAAAGRMYGALFGGSKDTG